MNKRRKSLILSLTAFTFSLLPLSATNTAIAQDYSPDLIEKILYRSTLSAKSLRTCERKHDTLKELGDDAKSTFRQRESMIKTINRMSDGYGRRALVKAARNLGKIYEETWREIDHESSLYDRKCGDVSVSYKDYKKVCGTREYMLREGSYCSTFSSGLVEQLKEEKGWN